MPAARKTDFIFTVRVRVDHTDADNTGEIADRISAVVLSSLNELAKAARYPRKIYNYEISETIARKI